MNSELRPKTVKLSYPSLMQITTDNVVVLFTEPGTGVVVNSSSAAYKIGQYSEGWNMNNFKVYDGEIILSN